MNGTCVAVAVAAVAVVVVVSMDRLRDRQVLIRANLEEWVYN